MAHRELAPGMIGNMIAEITRGIRADDVRTARRKDTRTGRSAKSRSNTGAPATATTAARSMSVTSIAGWMGSKFQGPADSVRTEGGAP